MKIAVCYSPEDQLIFPHFGQTQFFKLYQLEDDEDVSSEIISEAVIEANGSGHDALASLMDDEDVDVVICDKIGEGAYNALKEADITVYGGIRGYADAAVQALRQGILAYLAQSSCQEHEQGHEGCCCGGQGDGGDGCGCH